MKKTFLKLIFLLVTNVLIFHLDSISAAAPEDEEEEEDENITALKEVKPEQEEKIREFIMKKKVYGEMLRKKLYDDLDIDPEAEAEAAEAEK